MKNINDQLTGMNKKMIEKLFDQGLVTYSFVEKDAEPVLDALGTNRQHWPMSNWYGNSFPATLPDGSPLPKVSVVTPTFNQGNTIAKTIMSVYNQHYPNLEYLVIDAQSTDNTLEVVDVFRDKIDYFVSEPDDGQSDAINKGMKIATGDILTWINSDDMISPGALYAMALAFWLNKDADLVAGINNLYLDEELHQRGMTCTSAGTLPLKGLLDIENRWLFGKFFYQPEVYFTRDIWDRAGGKVDVDAYYSMDYELWVRFAEVNANLAVIGRSQSFYRMDPNQKSFYVENYKPELLEIASSYRKKHNLTENEKIDNLQHGRTYSMGFFAFDNYEHPLSSEFKRLAATCAMGANEARIFRAKPGTSLTPARIVEQINYEANKDIGKPNLIFLSELDAVTDEDLGHIYPGAQLVAFVDSEEQVNRINNMKMDRKPVCFKFDAFSSSPDVNRFTPVTNLGVFYPCDKMQSRQQLELPENKLIIIKEESTVLTEALHKAMLDSDIQILVIEDLLSKLQSEETGPKKQPLDKLKSIVLSSADYYFYCPDSTYGNGSIVEASACGVPVLVEKEISDSSLLVNGVNCLNVSSKDIESRNLDTSKRCYVDISLWSRFYAEDMFSFAHLYWQLMTTLADSGVLDQDRIAHKINLRFEINDYLQSVFL